MYCRFCGKEIDDDSAYCPCCGKRIHTDQVSSYGGVQFANFLAQSSLGLAKVMAIILCGGLAGACGFAAVGSLILSGYLFYHFAKGLAVTVPWFLTGTLPVASVGGGGLLLSSLTGLLVALLLGMASAALARCLWSSLLPKGAASDPA